MSKIYVQIVKIQKHIHQFNFPPSFNSFRHSLNLYEATERRTSETTLKHKTFCQLDVCYTRFPNVVYFHTLIHMSHANTCLISHSGKSGSRNVSATSSKQISHFSGFPPCAGKISIKGPFETGPISREFVIRTPCLCELQRNF